ncbi:MAG: hypothetical protein GKS04_03120 [Candidatus Mycalebacterium zealandia]|nr:MAG: hypothetical protein GKS04_03120 [Candidatus Mycalebacterium zealandia]
MSHKNEKFSFLYYLADRLSGPLVAATLVGCLLSGKLEMSHIVLFSIGLILFFISYIHDIRHH